MVIELWGFTVYSEYRKFGINFCCFEDVFTSNLGPTFTENIQKAVQIEPSPSKITKYIFNKIGTGAYFLWLLRVYVGSIMLSACT